MAILADYHLHSSFSGDSEAPMEQMILSAIQKGLHHICFTEHMDFNYPPQYLDNPDRFELDTDAYFSELLRLREKYQSKLQIRFGVELGMQPSCLRTNINYTREHFFDFIIASSHLCHGRDPYFPSFFEGRSEWEAYLEYFESILENIRVFRNFDVYGHLDYVVRYGPSKDENYTYAQYSDVIDEILTALIDNEKGIELNTAGLSNGLKGPNPCLDIIKRYKELGGEIITIGSDSHTPDTISAHFDKAAGILTDCGFKYYSVFENRVAEFIRI